MVEAGDRIGIIGTGQLGRMLAMAAAKLGLRSIVYGPQDIGPARSTARSNRLGAYDDAAALSALAAECRLITYELEHLPIAALEPIARSGPVYPGLRALAVAQDRLREKTFLRDAGIATADFAAVDGIDDLRAAARTLGLPLILKTRRDGYDGKGQVRLNPGDDGARALAAIGQVPAIVERQVAFTRELSVIIARRADGAAAVYPVMENEHRDHILHHTTVPAAIAPDRHRQAEAIARTIADALDYVGVLTVELFDTEAGLLVNELAPRVHNSGHWTIEGAVTSQFEQHIRAIAGLPLGDARMLAPSRMLNLVAGRSELDLARLLQDPAAHVHLYGKRQPQPGRKMGHVTWVDA